MKEISLYFDGSFSLFFLLYSLQTHTPRELHPEGIALHTVSSCLKKLKNYLSFEASHFIYYTTDCN